MKANFLSLLVKIVGCSLILTAVTLKGFGIWKIDMAEVVAGVIAIQALVLPIDISKIKTANAQKGDL